MFNIFPHKGLGGQGIYELAFLFAPNGASAVDNTLNRSLSGSGIKAGITVTRTGAGVFQVDLAEPVSEVLDADADLLGGAIPAGFEAYYSGNVGPTGGSGAAPGLSNQGRRFTVTIQNAAGAAADLAASTGRFCRVRLTCRLTKGT